ncbi:MAG: aminotransferase class V-fold PLP-dependent enzyme [Calditrichaeota bacterium]|nr:MAG: aminotransferase class V-fold PLP-dependent enzyme [Calditrichota bacterium]
MAFNKFRPLFPFLVNKLYFNHAAVSPLSTDVRDRMDWFVNERCFGEIEFYEDVLNMREQTRASIARLIHAEAQNIAFTGNTSEGFNWLVNGLEWREGDEIILTDMEFPANVYPFLNLESRGVKVLFIKNRNGMIDPEDIRRAITPRTRLVSVSFVEFLNGFRNDLAAISALCREHDVLFSVDAIQGMGVIPLDVSAWPVDFLSCGGHKWLMGPMGAGFMYIAPGLLKQLKPVFAGWLSVKNAWDFFDYKLDWEDDARRFEYGTQNFLGIAGLGAAIDLLLRAGVPSIEQHVLILGQQIVDGMTDLGFTFLGSADPAHWSGIYSFRHEQAEKVYTFLRERRIFTSLREGAIRIAPHFYNSREDIVELLDTCDKALSLL